MIYFLDTNICAFILNGKFPKLNERYIKSDKRKIKIPSVVLFELFYGAEKSQKRERNLANIQTFCRGLVCLRGRLITLNSPSFCIVQSPDPWLGDLLFLGYLVKNLNQERSHTAIYFALQQNSQRLHTFYVTA